MIVSKMASACINNIALSPEPFLDCPPSAYGWKKKPEASSDPFTDFGDFEFRLHDDPVAMLPADQLFADGKLMPLQLTATRPDPPEEKRSGPENEPESVRVDPYLFSPKAPRCSSHWRELLGLRKLHHKANATVTSSSSTTTVSAGKSIRNFLHRSTRSDVSLNAPLLKDSDSESHSICSSRHSLSSSSSSGHDHDDLPRLSLDADIKSCRARSGQGAVRPRVKLAKPRMVPVAEDPAPKPLIDHPSAPTVRQSSQDPASTGLSRAVSVDSPRLSSSGKIVFYGLERSSSSPSTFNGGPRHKHRGMERSYSANVRVTPVLNVPLCKSGVFGLFSSQSSSSSQKKDGNNNNNNNGSSSSGSGPSRSHHHHQNHHSGSARIRRVESSN